MNLVIHRFEQTASTNDLAVAGAREGGAEGEVFVSESQTAGRGRLGRRWESPRGKNLYVSILLRPACPPAQAALLTLVAGTAVHDLLADLLPGADRLKIKWPNDLYWGDKKVAGILTEMESQGNRLKWVVVGIGVDLNADPEDFSPEVREKVTSVKMATARAVDRETALNRLLEAFGQRYDEFTREGPSKTISFCEAHSYLNGRHVRWDDGGERTGVVAGLSPEGHLRVKTEEGIVSILAGDVTPSVRT
ncbi:MAG TPA: biotin--[acetyl-CoA-carboxylase] ligase [bacterium]|nr:biotin--[acetyl-CoA-carboxylase] ligase [bacterium]